MTVAELKAQMMSKNMQPYYIFAGTEIGVRDIYIKQIAKMGGFEIKWVETPQEIVAGIRRRNVLGNPILFILSECNEMVKNEKAWKILELITGKNMLLLLFTSLDKRLKFYKEYKDSIVEFDPLEPLVLKKYIQKEIALSDKNCEILMDVCEGDYGRCLLEIDKIKRFDHEATNSAFEHLLKAGVIYQPPKDAIFDFVDAVMSRDARSAFALMQESYDSGEATLVMISNLYTNFKALLQVQSCKSRDIAKCTGLAGWQITNAKKHLNKYRTGELVQAMLTIREAEVGIKSGTIDEQVAVPYILVNVL